MQSALALLSHPVGTYACVVTAGAACSYGWHARSISAAFTAGAAMLAAAVGFADAPPSGAGLLLLVLGIALLHGEFLVPTYGVALVAGLAVAATASWLLLETGPGATPLPPLLRLAMAAAGAVVLLAAVLRGFRRYTLRRHSLEPLP
jgi:membrane-bound serine protease (ClpP class)